MDRSLLDNINDVLIPYYRNRFAIELFEDTSEAQFLFLLILFGLRCEYFDYNFVVNIVIIDISLSKTYFILSNFDHYNFNVIIVM